MRQVTPLCQLRHWLLRSAPRQSTAPYLTERTRLGRMRECRGCSERSSWVGGSSGRRQLARLRYLGGQPHSAYRNVGGLAGRSSAVAPSDLGPEQVPSAK